MAKSTTGSSADASAKSVGSVALVKFNFHGDELDVIPMGARAHISIKRVCEALGVDFSRQLRKLKDDPAICVDMMSIQVPGDDQRREVACIEVRSLPLWLATIHPSKVKPEVREKLIAYRREAAEVLADHFLGKRGALPEGAMSKEEVQRMHLRYVGKLSEAETTKARLLEENADLRATNRALHDAGSSFILPAEKDELDRLMAESTDLLVALRGIKPKAASVTVRRKVIPGCFEPGFVMARLEKGRVPGAMTAARVLLKDLTDQARARGLIPAKRTKRQRAYTDHPSFFDLLKIDPVTGVARLAKSSGAN